MQKKLVPSLAGSVFPTKECSFPLSLSLSFFFSPSFLGPCRICSIDLTIPLPTRFSPSILQRCRFEPGCFEARILGCPLSLSQLRPASDSSFQVLV